MLEKLFAKLARLKPSVKFAIAAAVVAAVLLAFVCGIGLQKNTPVGPSQEGTQQEQQENLPEEETPLEEEEYVESEDDILEAEDVEDAEDAEEDKGGLKDVISGIIDFITGNDKEEEKESSSSVQVNSGVRYTVKFETNGGGKVTDKSVARNTKISRFPTPYKEGFIFLGWCYDEALTEPVESDDVVTKSMTLYASYLEQSPLEVFETVHFASAENVGKDFTIKVISTDGSMTADDVKAAIIAKTTENITEKASIQLSYKATKNK